MNHTYIISKEDDVSKYFKEIRKYEPLTAEKEVELAERIKEGDKEAEHELIKANLKFVVSVAKRYMNQGLSLGDLINEGNLGIIKAAKRYDHTRGFKFISYAVWWIQQSILQSLNDNARTIRIPNNVLAKIYSKENEPTEDLDIPRCTSIHDKINEDGGELLDLIEEPQEEEFDPDDRIKEELMKALSILTDRERSVIIYYYGLDPDFTPMTLDGIGDMFDITKERVRQIKVRALRKLRYNSSNLFDAMNE